MVGEADGACVNPVDGDLPPTDRGAGGSIPSIINSSSEPTMGHKREPYSDNSTAHDSSQSQNINDSRK